MGQIRKQPDVVLFCAVTWSDPELFAQALLAFTDRYGPVKSSYGPVDFSAFTSYYRSEMGENLKKTYLIFERPIDRDTLSEIKHFTNRLEENSAAGTNRLINFDPGYINTDKLVLASTKDFYHRISIGNGIFAEVTLHVRHGRWRFFSWTYGDYKADSVIALLNEAKKMLG